MEIAIQQNSKYGLVVSSRVIAKELGKQHKNVLADLDKIFENNRAEVSALFIETKYKALNGKMNKEYLLTKDGFTLYMFNIQGYQEFKMAYIRKFNEMEKALEQKKLPVQVPLSFDNMKVHTFDGSPVMEANLLHLITKIPKHAILYRAKEHGALLLIKSNLRKYKSENREDSRTLGKLLVLYKEHVITICKIFGVYEQVKDIIENYFKVDNRIEYKEKIDFNDKYWDCIQENIEEAYKLECKIEQIYKEELNPIYDNIISLIKSKKNMISGFNCMKYGNPEGIK